MHGITSKIFTHVFIERTVTSTASSVEGNHAFSDTGTRRSKKSFVLKQWIPKPINKENCNYGHLFPKEWEINFHTDQSMLSKEHPKHSPKTKRRYFRYSCTKWRVVRNVAIWKIWLASVSLQLLHQYLMHTSFVSTVLIMLPIIEFRRYHVFESNRRTGH